MSSQNVPASMAIYLKIVQAATEQWERPPQWLIMLCARGTSDCAVQPLYVNYLAYFDRFMLAPFHKQQRARERATARPESFFKVHVVKNIEVVKYNKQQGYFQIIKNCCAVYRRRFALLHATDEGILQIMSMKFAEFLREG